MSTPQALNLLPAPQPLPARLLDVIPTLPVGEQRWMADGVTWMERPASVTLTRAAAGCAPADVSLTPRGCEDVVIQKAFRLFDALSLATSDWISAHAGSTDLVETFRLYMSAAFATELLTAAASTGHGFDSDAVAPTGLAFGSAATPLWNAIAVLESDLASKLLGTRGYIHLTPGLMSVAISDGLVRWVGDHWETGLGNIVVSDAGYVDAPAPSGESASAAGEDWVYASGPVWYLATEPDVDGGDFTPESWTYSTNTVEKWIDASGILVYSPALVSAALAAYARG